MKNKNLFIVLLVIILSISISISACSNANDYTTVTEKKDSFSDWSEGLPEDFYDDNYGEENSNEGEDVVNDLTKLAYKQKLIKNAEMSLVTVDPIATQKKLSNSAKSLGGYVSHYSQDHLTYKSVRLIVNVPQDSLDKFIEEINNDESIDVINQTVSSDDVSKTYYDTKTRLESTEELISHYRELLKKAKTIEDTLDVQKRIDELTLDLEAYKAHMQQLEQETSYSKVVISIEQKRDPKIENTSDERKPLSWENVKFYISNGFSKLGSTIALLGQYLLIGIVIGSPIIALVVVIILIIHFSRKNKKKKALEQADQQIIKDKNNSSDKKK